ncbi:CvpA family protein [soil metagenome]
MSPVTTAGVTILGVQFTVVDCLIVLILLLSLVIAAVRGLVREIIALVGWLVAIVVAWLYGPLLAHYMPVDWTAAARLLSGYCTAFFGTLILAAVMGYAAGKLVKAAGLGGVDRLLGAVFGLVRGLVVVVVMVALVSLTPWMRTPSWQQSQFVPYALALMDVAKEHLPERPPVETDKPA